MATKPLHLSPALLVAALTLPDDTDIHAVDFDEAFDRFVTIVVSHQDIPDAADHVEPMFRRTPEGRVEFLSWNPIKA